MPADQQAVSAAKIELGRQRICWANEKGQQERALTKKEYDLLKARDDVDAQKKACLEKRQAMLVAEKDLSAGKALGSPLHCERRMQISDAKFDMPLSWSHKSFTRRVVNARCILMCVHRKLFVNAACLSIFS